MEEKNEMQIMGSSANWISPANLEQGLKLAEMMATAKLMPDHLRGDKGSCLLVLEQASRWGMSPFAVAQCTSIVHGRLCFEGKLVAAALSAMRAIEGRLDYQIDGLGQEAKITISGTPSGAKKPCILMGSVKQWRTHGKDKAGNPMKNAWDTQPEDMLIYRGTRQWARRYAPEAMLGVYTVDEMNDEKIINITPEKPATIPETIEEKLEKAKAKNPPAPKTELPATTEEKPDLGPLLQVIGSMHPRYVAMARGKLNLKGELGKLTTNQLEALIVKAQDIAGEEANLTGETPTASDPVPERDF